MLFVTVGTHEQQFNRLIEQVDRWAMEVDEEVVTQIGFCTYCPQYCKWSRFFPYQTIMELVEEARIVITHGGPASFIMPLRIGKIPIVVPRRKEYGEHVNDHQVDFCKTVEKQKRNIIVVEDISCLSKTIEEYDTMVCDMRAEVDNNNTIFCKELEQIVSEIV